VEISTVIDNAAFDDILKRM